MFLAIIFTHPPAPVRKRSVVSHSNIEILSLDIRQPTDARFLLVTRIATTTSSGGIASVLEPVPLRIYYGDNQLGTATIPAQTLADGRTETEFVQDFVVAFPYTLNAFFHDFVQQRSVQWRLASDAISVTPRAFGLSMGQVSGVQLDKLVTLTGMNGPQQIEVLDIQSRSLFPPSFTSQTMLFNPSIGGVNITGSSVLNLRLKGVKFAEMWVPPFVLERGPNYLTGTVYLSLGGRALLENAVRAHIDVGSAAGLDTVDIQVQGQRCDQATGFYLNRIVDSIDVVTKCPLNLLKRLLPSFG